MKRTLLLRNPFTNILIKTGLFKFLLESYFKSKSSPLRKIRKDGSMPMSDSAYYEITMKCNLDCIMCHQTLRRKNSKTELDAEQVKKLIDNLSSAGVKCVNLIGGEVMVKKGIYDILDYIDKKGMKIILATNGMLINEEAMMKLEKLKNLSQIVYSLDGFEETHNKIRKNKLAFKKTVEAIKLSSGKHFLVILNCVVQKDNIEELIRIIRFAKELKVDIISFLPEFYYSNKSLLETQKGLGEKISIFTELREDEKADYHYKTFKNIIKRIESESRRQGIISFIYPDLISRYPKEFFNRELRKKNIPLGCKQLAEITINEKGELLACPFMNKYYGNLTENSLKELWNGKDIRNFRKKLIENNLVPICDRCCQVTYLKK